MIEKVSHVKNPLTVIAIFAGLAEVSGTVVLPSLEKETQQIYVWFLMGFPCLLVALFFFTLFCKHYVLYSPSDFRDDKSFSDLFDRGSGAVRVRKLQEEVEAETSADEAPRQSGAPSADAQGATQSIGNTLSANEVFSRDVRAMGLLAEELVLAKLSKELGVQFDRNVTPRGRPNVMFDGVAMAPGASRAIEIKFTRNCMYTRELLQRPFDRVLSFLESLPEDFRKNFQFVFAIVSAIDSPERFARLQSLLTSIAADYSFKTRIEIYSLSELEKEFKVS